MNESMNAAEMGYRGGGGLGRAEERMMEDDHTLLYGRLSTV